MRTEAYLSKYVRSYFEDHLTCRRNVSPCTLLSYRDAIKLFLRHAVAETKRSAAGLLVTDVTPVLVTSFLAHLEKERGNSIQTRNHRLIALRGLFEYIALQEPALAEHCRRILTIPSKRNRGRREITYLERHELTAVLEAIDREAPLGQRDYALLLFMYNTGARVQEAADARRSWLSLQPPCKVEILGKGSKWRTCPLWESVAAVLRQYLDTRSAVPEADGHLFINRYGKAMSRFGIWNMIGKYAKRAAVAAPSLQAKRVTPHVIRHTTAMHLLQSGVDINVIRSWLGHVNLETTHRYVEIDMEMKRKALQACELSGTATQGQKWHPAPDIIVWLNSL